MREIVSQKLCDKCGLIRESGHFIQNRKWRGGLEPICKNCRFYIDPSVDLSNSHWCLHCHNFYLATTEYFPKRTNGTLYPECKSCRRATMQAHNSQPKVKERNRRTSKERGERNKEKAKQRREANKEKLKEYTKKYNTENKEKKSLYRQFNREYEREYSNQYNALHKEEIKEKYKAFMQTERGKIKNKTQAANHRARKMQAEGTYTDDQIQDQIKRQKRKCYYCGKKLGKGKAAYHIDHTFPLTREWARNDISHLVIACPSCNTKKGNKYPWEWPEGGRLL